jgi:hypothetical protein
MSKALLLCVAVFSVSSIASAQETPHYEFFVGGSATFVHANGSELTQLLNLPAIQYQPHSINLELVGWEATVVENVNKWLGGEVDASGFYGSPIAGFLYPSSELVSPSPNFSKTVPIILRIQNFLFGPRVTWRRAGSKFVFFAHLPLGVAYSNASLSSAAVIASNFKVLPAGTIKSSMGPAISPGVGLDIRFSHALMIRPIQVDYLITHVFGQRQDNARVSAGLNFVFGEK